MEISTAIEAIIWDLDGTLVDSFDIFMTVLADAAAQYDIAVPDREMALHNYHGSLEASVKAVLQLKDGPLLTNILDEFLDIQNEYYESPNDHLFADALSLALQANRAGLKQFIITNRFHGQRGSASPRTIVVDSELRDIITDIVCGDETLHHKPDAAVAWPLFEKYSLDRRSVLVIGDQHVDAELARNLGCQAVIVNRHGLEAHLDNIPHWQDFATSVASLDSVVLS